MKPDPLAAYRAWYAAALERDRRERRGPVLVQAAGDG
jgi:hypothetical protein